MSKDIQIKELKIAIKIAQSEADSYRDEYINKDFCTPEQFSSGCCYEAGALQVVAVLNRRLKDLQRKK